MGSSNQPNKGRTSGNIIQSLQHDTTRERRTEQIPGQKHCLQTNQTIQLPICRTMFFRTQKGRLSMIMPRLLKTK
jgi:hypothetical protein